MTMQNNSKLQEYLEKLDIPAKDFNLFQQVFVHRSYLNEHRSFPLPHNERLEFLGDAVLELVVTDFLYKNYENPEGELTAWRAALVRGEMLSKIAHQIGMEDYLLMSKGERKSQGRSRDYLLANAFEALIGAIYLDLGYEEARKFIEKHLLVRLDNVLENQLYLDAKSHLQEIAQEKLSITPNYKTLKEEGPDHDKTFIVGVYVGDKLLAEGKGQSKQKAEQDAAKNALEDWEK